MPATKEIKRRIKSVKNTKKITKAMELVSAAKMKRAVASTLASRAYSEYSWEMLTSVSENISELTHPLFVERDVKRVLLVLVTSNRGLCGGYNSQVIKKTLSYLRGEHSNAPVEVVAVGKKGDSAMRRIGQDVVATFMELPESVKLRDIAPISQMVMNEYIAGKYDKVYVAYTDYVSALTQKPNIKQILPISKTALKEMIEEEKEFSSPDKGRAGRGLTPQPPLSGGAQAVYLFEGDQDQLLGLLAEKLSRMQIYQMLLESKASEESSRMVAMKNASEAAGEMIGDLTLVFNKARQASITQEISEISAGMASVSS